MKHVPPLQILSAGGGALKDYILLDDSQSEHSNQSSVNIYFGGFYANDIKPNKKWDGYKMCQKCRHFNSIFISFVCIVITSNGVLYIHLHEMISAVSVELSQLSCNRRISIIIVTVATLHFLSFRACRTFIFFCPRFGAVVTFSTSSTNPSLVSHFYHSSFVPPCDTVIVCQTQTKCVHMYGATMQQN